MQNTVSFNQILNTQQNRANNYNSTIDAASSFGNILSSSIANLDKNSTPSNLGGTGLLSGSFRSGDLMLSLVRNLGDSNSVLQMFLSIIGASPSSGIGSVMNKFNNNFDTSDSRKISNGLGFEEMRNSNSKAIPSEAWKASNPSIRSNYTNRSAQLYRSVIDQFNVEANPRYTPYKAGRNDTYCNIFLWDVTRAMGAEIPHKINPDTKEPMYYPNTKGAVSLSANRTYDWLHEKGEEYGWKEVSAETAQYLANQGRPVVTAKKNRGKSGHVQVVCPSKDGAYDPKRGVTVAQAGSSLYNYTPITRIYGSSLSQVTYFAHI